MRAGARRGRLGHHLRGFVLLEVIVAAFIAGFLVIHIASSMQNVVAMARNLRSDAARLCEAAAEGAEGAAWTWGPMVATAAWDMGPQLKVRVRSCAGATAAIGAWADGWKIGGWEIEAARELVVTDAVWGDLAGREVVLRVREPEGAWGPPWRSIVPDVWGALPIAKRAQAGDASADPWVSEEASIVHVPWLSSPALTASWTTTPARGSVLGLCWALSTSGGGWSEVALGARRQAWYSAERRWVDVYF